MNLLLPANGDHIVAGVVIPGTIGSGPLFFFVDARSDAQPMARIALERSPKILTLVGASKHAPQEREKYIQSISTVPELVYFLTVNFPGGAVDPAR